MRTLHMIALCAAFTLLLSAPYARAQTAVCPGGIVNVVSLGADGTAANDTAAFNSAYLAVTTHSTAAAPNPCEGNRIYVPAGNWAGHWPTIYYSVYIQGAGPSATNFTGDDTAWPIFWVFAPVTFDSFGFWGSPNLNIRLDGSSTGNSDLSVLENLLCRTSSGMFIYDTNNEDVHFENLEALNCGNTTSSPWWLGGTVVLNGANNIYIDSPVFMGEPNSAIVANNAPSVIIYGGEVNNAFAFTMTSPLIYAVNSTAIWVTDFYIGGTNYYDLGLGNAPVTTFSGYQVTFGSGAEGICVPGSNNSICN